MIVNQNNYQVWAMFMDSELDNIGCSQVIATADKGGIPAEVDKKAYHLLLRHLDEFHLGIVSNGLSGIGLKSGRMVWDLLKEKYAGEEVLVRIEKDEMTFKMKDHPSALIGKNPGGNNNKGNRNKREMDKSGTVCHNCRNKGHWVKDCPEAYRSNGKEQHCASVAIVGSGPKSACDGTSNSTGLKVDEDHERHDPAGENLINSEVNHFLCIRAQKGSTNVSSAMAGRRHVVTALIDSGCTDHMFTNREYFHVLKNYSGRVNIGERGRTIPISGIGSVKMENHLGKEVVFDNAYFVPDLPYNLILLN